MFMKFWKAMNEVLKSRDLPEMTYGEAHRWFDKYERSLSMRDLDEQAATFP